MSVISVAVIEQSVESVFWLSVPEGKSVMLGRRGGRWLEQEAERLHLPHVPKQMEGRESGVKLCSLKAALVVNPPPASLHVLSIP